MNIFLIGFMGSGKTTIGKKLARQLNMDFIDMDDYIENVSGKTIAKIFEEEGEASFRQMEKNTLKELFQLDNKIIATGGGTPCFFDNMEQMNKNGMTFYLQMTPKALADRLVHGMEKRPLVKNKSRHELEDFITETLEKRKSFYSQAQHYISALNMKVEDFLPYFEK